MSTWTIELRLIRDGKEDLENRKHVRMDGLTKVKQAISLRKTVIRMTEDFIAILNNE